MMMTIGHLQAGRDGDRGRGRRRAVLASQLDAEQSHSELSRRAPTVVPIWQSPFGAQTYWLPAIGVLGGMGVLILLVVCANVANLVLVRGVSRRGELAVRLALGASRGRLLRLLFVENLVLAHPRRTRRRRARRRSCCRIIALRRGRQRAKRASISTPRSMATC